MAVASIRIATMGRKTKVIAQTELSLLPMVKSIFVFNKTKQRFTSDKKE